MFSGGTGTEKAPYLISTPEQFDEVRNYLDSHFKMISDIDLSSFDNFEPIGSSKKPFTGKYDGNGYQIQYLKIEQKIIANSNVKRHDYYAAPFSYIKGGSVTGLGITNASVSLEYESKGNQHLGHAAGIAGNIENGSIDKCYFTGTVTTVAKNMAYARAGGIASHCCGGSTITNCYSNLELYASAENANTMAAGIVCWLEEATVMNCYAAGSGTCINNSGNKYSGNINASADNSKKNVINNCVGLMQSRGKGSGVIIGIGNWTIQNNNILLNPDVNSQVNKARAQSTYEDLGWDFKTIWKMGDIYPELR